MILPVSFPGFFFIGAVGAVLYFLPLNIRFNFNNSAGALQLKSPNRPDVILMGSVKFIAGISPISVRINLDTNRP
jgi:hypothetical protein